MIFRFTAFNVHTRIYVDAESIDAAIAMEDEVWEYIKLHDLAGGDRYMANMWYEDEDEEIRDRQFRMEGWTDHDNWSASGPIVVDSHY